MREYWNKIIKFHFTKNNIIPLESRLNFSTIILKLLSTVISRFFRVAEEDKEEMYFW